MNINPIEIYNIAVKKVPAYKKFLIKKCGKIPSVKTIEDFENLPLTDKKEYVLKYPIEELSLGGTLIGKHFIYRSSGTTGNPVYWPKLPEEEKEMPHWLGVGLNEAHNINKIPTLIIVGLGLGSWISGEQTSWAMRSLAVQDNNITVITPGTNIEEMLEIIKEFCPHFPQTLLISYPPFAKTIIEEALRKKLPLKKYNLKLGLVGESYSENFRDYASKILGHKKEEIMAIWSGYGSADCGTMGRETPLTIILRRILYKKNFAKKIFGVNDIPSICQYSPAAQYFEAANNELVITKYQGIPLVRYKTGDNGQIFSYKDLINRFKKEGIDPVKALKENGFKGEITELPFVLVYGRIDGSASFYGAKITVEQIKEILERSPLNKNFTGKFKMSIKQNKKLNPVLNIILEIGKMTTCDGNIAEIIADKLAKINTEYRNTLREQGEKALPKVKFVKRGYFDKGIKISYV